jgi:hypothetical protein
MLAQGLNLPSNLRQEAFWGNCERISATDSPATD